MTWLLTKISEIVTIVEDSTHLSAEAALETGSATLSDNFQCTFDPDEDSASCINSIVIAGGGTTTTISETQSGQILDLTLTLEVVSTTSAATSSGTSWRFGTSSRSGPLAALYIAPLMYLFS